MMKNKKAIIAAILVSAGFFLAIGFFYPRFNLVNGQATESSNDIDSRDHQASNEKDEHKEHRGNKEHGDHEENGKHGKHDEEDEETIHLSAAEMKEFGIELGNVAPGKLHTYVSLPGEVTVNPDRLAHIVPRMPGIVRKVRKTLGDPVQAGEIMAILDSKEMGQAKIEYFTAKGEVDVAKAKKDVATTQVDVVKTYLDIATISLNIAATNLEWQKVVHENTIQLLKSLKKNTSIDDIIRDFTDKPIGENRTRLLSAYASLNYARAAYKRESGLRKKRISSESDFLQAQKEFGSTKSDFEAIYEEVGFNNRIALMEKMQAFESAKQAVKAAGQAVKVAEQEKKVAEVSLKVAISSLRSAERKLHVFGLIEKEISELKDEHKADAKNLSRYVMRAPFNGIVIEKHITLGEVLKDDSKAFAIADLSSVWVNLNVYQKDLSFVRKNQPVIISAGGEIADIKSIISWVRPLVGEETRTSLALVVLPNREGRWLPGLFVNGKIEIGDVNVPLMILKSAIQTIEDRQSVFIRTEDGFEPQPVTVGRESEDYVEIISGLKPGQRYVKKGAFTLKAQLAKGSFSGGHGH